MDYFLIIFVLLVTPVWAIDGNKKLDLNRPLTYQERVSGMLWCSAIADALGGPFEGRKTVVSQKFLEEGHWISELKPYNRWFQNYWNVYPREAVAGTYTDDNRMRLLIAQSMIVQYQQHPEQLLSQTDLASVLFDQYRDARKEYEKLEGLWQSATAAEKESLKEPRKEKFLHTWFSWELAKTATSVFIPENPPLLSPGHQYTKILNSEGAHIGEWDMTPVPTFTVTADIKSSYHFDCYARGEEMPLGQIALLPLAAYFPGDPAAAFQYALEINFLDIAGAPLYPAVMIAILADVLGGTDWDIIREQLQEPKLIEYVQYSGSLNLRRIQSSIHRALTIGSQFQDLRREFSIDRYIQFVKTLHGQFADGEDMMCHVDEMLGVTIALVDISPPDINLALEMAVNYGRDNDTVGSMVGCFLGAQLGDTQLKPGWRTAVELANLEFDIQTQAMGLSKMQTIGK